MNAVISTCTNKNPDKLHNEDLIGSYGNVFWLLDGASHPKTSESILSTQQYVHILSQKILGTLQTFSTSAPLQLIVTTSIKKIAELIKHEYSSASFFPSSTVVMVRIAKHEMEYFVLGDSSLVLKMGTKVEQISDQRLQQIGLNIRDEIVSLLQQGHGYSSPEVKRLKSELIELEDTYRNKKNGFYVASIDPNVCSHALTGKRKLDPNLDWSIALLSDGLTRLVDTFEIIPSWEEFISHLAKTHALELINNVRSIEHSDPDGQKYPRFSKHDDASMIMIQNNKGDFYADCR
jgi:serine/threonine protein phosphatase PrpC